MADKRRKMTPWGAYPTRGGVARVLQRPSPNGKIYSIPHRHNKVLVIDPETHETTYLANSETDGGHWGAVLTPHGSIIGVPREASNVLMIDFGSKVPKNWALSRLYNKF